MDGRKEKLEFLKQTSVFQLGLRSRSASVLDPVSDLPHHSSFNPRLIFYLADRPFCYLLPVRCEYFLSRYDIMVRHPTASNIQHIQQQHSNSIQPWPWRRRRRPPVRYPIHSSLETKTVPESVDFQIPETQRLIVAREMAHSNSTSMSISYRSCCSFHSMSIWLPRDM